MTKLQTKCPLLNPSSLPFLKKIAPKSHFSHGHILCKINITSETICKFGLKTKKWLK